MDQAPEEDHLVARILYNLKMDPVSAQTSSPRTAEQMQMDVSSNNAASMTQTLVSPGHHLAASTPGPSTGMPSAGTGSSTLVHIPMCLRLKTLEERERAMRAPAPYPDYVCLPMVNKTHFTKHGPILRLLTDGIKTVPSEVTSIRLDFLYEDSIPQFLYANLAALKKWGIDKVIEYTRQSGYNTLDHPKLDYHHFMVKFMFASLSPLLRETLGTSEAGLWVCHYPDFIQRLRGRCYEDNSTEDVVFINMHVSLIPVHARVHVPEGGWSPQVVTVEAKKTEGPAEKKAKTGPPAGRSRQQPHRPSPDAEKKMVEEIDNLKRTVDDMRRQAAIPYPSLPPSQVVPGGATPCNVASDDGPTLVAPQPTTNPVWVSQQADLPKFL
jgi:hypothetical protein